MSHTRPLICALLAGAALVGCNRVASTLADDEPEALVIVGQVRLVPRLAPGEQENNTPRGEREIFWFHTDDQWRRLTSVNRWSAMAGAVRVPLERTYFARAMHRSFYILLGSIQLRCCFEASARAYLPGGFKVEVQDHDNAVYIGTLVYHRDRLFNISDVEVVDEYDAARLEFEAQYPGYSLRKSLVTPVDPRARDDVPTARLGARHRNA